MTRARAPLFPAYLVSEHVASNGHSHLHKHDERQEDGKLQKHRAGVGFDPANSWCSSPTRPPHHKNALQPSQESRCPPITHCNHKTGVLLAGPTAAHKGHQEEEGAHCNDDHRQQGGWRGLLADGLIQENLSCYTNCNQSHGTGLGGGKVGLVRSSPSHLISTQKTDFCLFVFVLF